MNREQSLPNESVRYFCLEGCPAKTVEFSTGGVIAMVMRSKDFGWDRVPPSTVLRSGQEQAREAFLAMFGEWRVEISEQTRDLLVSLLRRNSETAKLPEDLPSFEEAFVGFFDLDGRAGCTIDAPRLGIRGFLKAGPDGAWKPLSPTELLFKAEELSDEVFFVRFAEWNLGN